MRRVFIIALLVSLEATLLLSSVFAEAKKPVSEAQRIEEKRQREAECRANNTPLNRCFSKTKAEPSPSPSKSAVVTPTVAPVVAHTPEYQVQSEDDKIREQLLEH